MNTIPTPKQVQQMNKSEKLEAFNLFLKLGYAAKAALKMSGL